MRRGVRAALALATGLGLAASGCGRPHRDASTSGGYAQPPSAVPPSAGPPSAAPASPPSSEVPGSRAPSTEAPAPSANPEPRRAPTFAPSAGPLGIRTKETRYGRILVDGRGMTIYVSGKDDADFESTCAGPCTKEWPPLFTNGQVTAGPGVNSAWLGTIGRSDGPTQVEYDGWPLYYSTRDTEPGEIKGQRVRSNGTTWYVVDADKGKKVT
ncbi:MAG: COG4315 family predicted lipoprotein [Actinoallomurus sp.]